MTTIAPPKAPAQGIAGAPVAVAVGVITSIAFPPSQAGAGSPVPTLFPWVVLANASPFTIVVSTGATTIQIPAFNSDKVFIWPGGGPSLTFVAVAGAAPPQPGTDSTVYSTFFADEPPGQYPAFIGPGAPQQVNTLLYSVTNSTSTLARGPFSVTGFGSFTLYANEQTGTPGNVLQVQIQWTTLTGLLIAVETFIVQAGGSLGLTAPNLGPQITVQILPNAGGTYTSALLLNSLVAGPVFNLLQGDLFNVWTPSVPTVLAGATAQFFGSGGPTFAGPVILHLNLAKMAVWDVTLQQQNSAGAWSTFREWTTGAFSNSGVAMPLLIPPYPLRLQVFNNTAANKTIGIAMTPDNRRAA